MCIRVRYAPRCQISDPWDASRLVITIPDHLQEPFAMEALRAVLIQMDVEQDEFGARCWCGEQIELLPIIPQQRRSDEVKKHHAA